MKLLPSVSMGRSLCPWVWYPPKPCVHSSSTLRFKLSTMRSNMASGKTFANQVGFLIFPLARSSSSTRRFRPPISLRQFLILSLFWLDAHSRKIGYLPLGGPKILNAASVAKSRKHLHTLSSSARRIMHGRPDLSCMSLEQISLFGESLSTPLRLPSIAFVKLRPKRLKSQNSDLIYLFKSSGRMARYCGLSTFGLRLQPLLSLMRLDMW